MNRPIAIIGAPSSIGIRPYDDGGQRRLDLAPAALRARRLVERLAARDLGDVIPPAYRDFTRRPGTVRNEAGVAEYSGDLADRVAGAVGDGAFVLVLGGDCSIVLGSLLGVRRAGVQAPGLAYVDAHADFATPELSQSGSAASMCLALATGRGDSTLARLLGDAPLARERDVVVIGRHDDEDVSWYGADALRRSPMLDLTRDAVRAAGPAEAARRALERLAASHAGRFWIHLDADVLDPSVMPAVDSPEPGGLGLDELAAVVAPLAGDPRALGLQLTIYDPELDTDGSGARRLADLLVRVLAPERRPEPSRRPATRVSDDR